VLLSRAPEGSASSGGSLGGGAATAASEAVSWTVKIADFGLARSEASLVTSGIGTPAYMAPELFEVVKVVPRQHLSGVEYEALLCS